MAKQIDRLARKRARIQRRANSSELDLNFGPEDEAVYVDLVKKLNKGGTVSNFTDQELATFVKLSMRSPGKETIDKLNALAGKEGIKPEEVGKMIEAQRATLSDPANKKRLLELSRKQDIANKNTMYSNALGLMLSAGDIAAGQKQISEFQRRTKELKRPTRPGPMAADPYLDAAKKVAERGTYGETIAAKAARQQSFDAYQQDIQNVRVASTGQAGAYGAGAQAAVTRLGRRGAEMAPQIEAMRQGREQQRAQMAGLSAQENAARYKTMADMYPFDLETYQAESKAIGEMGAAGYQNRRLGMAEMAPFAATMYGNERINRRYNALTNQLMSMGVPPEQAQKTAQDAMPRVAPPTGYNIPKLPDKLGAPSRVYTGKVGYDIPKMPDRLPVPPGMFPAQLSQSQQLANEYGRTQMPTTPYQSQGTYYPSDQQLADEYGRVLPGTPLTDRQMISRYKNPYIPQF